MLKEELDEMLEEIILLEKLLDDVEDTITAVDVK